MTRFNRVFLPIAVIAGLLLAGTCLHADSTIEQRLHQYGNVVQGRLEPLFDQAGVPYPPTRLVFVILKAERQLQIYAGEEVPPGKKIPYTFITYFPILAESGVLGPKLKEGDGQVPEGIYEVDGWNSNSRYHLALHVNYPNKEDQMHAKDEGRSNLGGNIMIHGSQVSLDGVAMGNTVAEDLFVLSALVRPNKTVLIFAPYDLRTGASVPPESSQMPQISWLHGLYERIGRALEQCPEPVTNPPPSPDSK